MMGRRLLYIEKHRKFDALLDLLSGIVDCKKKSGSLDFSRDSHELVRVSFHITMSPHLAYHVVVFYDSKTCFEKRIPA